MPTQQQPMMSQGMPMPTQQQPMMSQGMPMPMAMQPPSGQQPLAPGTVLMTPANAMVVGPNGAIQYAPQPMSAPQPLSENNLN